MLYISFIISKPELFVTILDISVFFPALIQILKYRLFFLGGRPGSARKTAENFQQKYPGIQIVGVYSPPFGFENDKAENRKIVNLIKGVRPDILFVGLGAPKQEKWIYNYRNDYNVPVSIAIGASFELSSGVVKRAPAWMQQTGLEWLWRLIMEPKRLWKRYLVEDMRFFWLLFKQKFAGAKTAGGGAS